MRDGGPIWGGGGEGRGGGGGGGGGGGWEARPARMIVISSFSVSLHYLRYLSRLVYLTGATPRPSTRADLPPMSWITSEPNSACLLPALILLYTTLN